MPGKKRKAAAKAPDSRKKPALEVNEAGLERPLKYKRWSEESMIGALRAVSQGMGVNRAALEFDVPRSTLGDRVSGKVTHGSKSGRMPYLTYSEEEELVKYIITCAKIGYPKRRDDIIGIVRKTLQAKTNGPVDFKGKGWWLRFMQRWPKLALRKGDALAQPRANAVTSSNLKHYFSLLEETLKNNDLLDTPTRIYNMDESGLPLDHKPSKVITLRGTKKVHCRTSGNKMQITILACANGVGTVVPPMVIFEGKRLNPEWCKGEVPCTLYGMSEKGWTDMELFSYWMKDLFLPNIPPARPVILLLDGHSSHYEPDTIRFAAKEGVVVLCLPPHTTHVSQPLDVSFFKPLKSYWSEACHQYMQDNPGRVVTKYQFSSLFSASWYKAIRPENIIAGFRKVGICPFNSKAITVPEVQYADHEAAIEGDGSDQGSSDESEDENSPSAEYDLLEAGMSIKESQTSNTTSTFTPEQLQLYQTRYENG